MLSSLVNSTKSILVPKRESSCTNDLRVANMAPVSLNDFGSNSFSTLLMYNGKYLLLSSSYPQFKCLSSTTVTTLSIEKSSNFSIVLSNVCVLSNGEVGFRVITISYSSKVNFSF